MNWKGCGRKLSWLNVRCYPGICLARLRKTTKHLIQNSWSPGLDLIPGFPECNAGVLTTRPRCFVVWARTPENGSNYCLILIKIETCRRTSHCQRPPAVTYGQTGKHGDEADKHSFATCNNEHPWKYFSVVYAVFIKVGDVIVELSVGAVNCCILLEGQSGPAGRAGCRLHAGNLNELRLVSAPCPWVNSS
jgi:hypothetical protein